MHIYHFIYARPLWLVALGMLVITILWGLLARRAAGKSPARGWKALNLVVLILSLLGILWVTLLGRTQAKAELDLIPFSTLTRAKLQPELYRQALMNVLAFLPLGLTLPELLPRGLSRKKRCLTAVLLALTLSVFVEAAQYFCGLGLTETDDLITNTLGALLGTAHLCLCPKIRKI